MDITLHKIKVRDLVAGYRDEGDDYVTRCNPFTDDIGAIKKKLNAEYADGGGDAPEDGLEALAYAIRSDWNPEGLKRRNIIVLWTDAPTHEIGFGSKMPNYPKGMPASFSELTEWWGDEQMESPFIKNAAKRLILFAPDQPYWTDIVNSWNNVIHYPSVAGAGLQEMTYREIIDAIYNSI